MGQYLPVVTMAVLAVLFAGISLLMSKLLAPRRSTTAKRAPYESGILPARDNPERFPVHFYLVAMIFVVFDIEIIFLYLISNGALDWGPVHRARRQSPMVSADRTSQTTIRRVGLEGRDERPEEVAV